MAEPLSAWLATTLTISQTAATALAYTIIVAGTVVVGNYQRRRQEIKARAAYNASLKDRELMLRTAVAPRRYLYGRDRVSGPIAYIESTGSLKEYLHVVLPLVAHECDAIEDVYFNEVKLSALDGNGDVTSGEFAPVPFTDNKAFDIVVPADGALTLPDNALGITSIAYGEGQSVSYVAAWTHTPGSNTVTIDATGLTGVTVTVYYTFSNPGTPLVRIKKYLGGAGQVADPDLVAASNGKWTSAHVGAGICYLYVRIRYDQAVFGSIGLPNISAVVRGKKVYDPRSGLTVWSDDAALCTADYLKATYGIRAVAGEVPDSEVAAAANVCGELVDLNLGGTVQQKRYTCNLSFTADMAPRDVLSDLLACMAGRAVWTQGRWLLRPGAYRVPTVTINESSLTSGITVSPRPSRTDLFNAVRATYRDPDKDYAEVQAPLVGNVQYKIEDGGVPLVKQIEMPMLCDEYRTQRLAKIELERGRQALTVRLSASLTAYDLAPTDTAYLTLSHYGWSGKVFEVMERTLRPDGAIDYTLRETASTVYAWNYGEATVGDPAPDTGLPSPFTPPAALMNFGASEGVYLLGDGTVISYAVLTWTASADNFVRQGGRLELEWLSMTDGGADWQPTPPLSGDAVTARVEPLVIGVKHLFRIRQVNASGRSGDWAYAQLNVNGLAGNAPDVADLAYEIKPGQVELRWTPCTAADYDVTELRYGGTSWTNATFLWSGRGSQYLFPRPANGSYLVRARHRNTTGTYSTNDATATVTVDDSIDPAAGESVIVEYSVDGATAWHSTFAAGDVFARWKIGPAGTWTQAFRIVGEAGTGGDYVDFIFRRAASQPSTPTGNTPAGWFDAPPAPDGNPLWASTATKTQAGVVVGVWSTPVKIDGDAGANGTRTARLRMYRWSASTPVTFPSGTSTYTWATGTFTAPATPNSWTLTPGAAVTGQTLWACEQAYSDALTDATSVVTWSTSTAFAVGAAGTDGNTGQTGQSNHRVYRAATIGVPPATPGNTVSGATPAGWSATPVTLTTGQEQYQSDGTTPAGSTTTTWSTPYPSYLKVGDLSAISANLGTITAGSLNTSGYIKAEGSTTQSVNISGTTESVTVAIVGNLAGANQYGVIGLSAAAGRAGVYGYNASSAANSAGVVGYSPNIGLSGAGKFGVSAFSAITGGAGVSGASLVAGSVGVQATGFSGGTALAVSGPMTITSNALVTNLNADLLDNQHGSYYNDSANLTGNIAAARMSTNVISAIGFTPVQQGGGAGQSTNKLYIGWNGSALNLQIDSTSFGSTWPIGVTGGTVRCTSLRIDQTPTTGAATATFPGTNKPGSSTSNVWLAIDLNGTTHYIPAWT